MNEATEALRALTALISDAVDRGFVAVVPPTLDPAAQRLFASLRLPVLFDVDAAPVNLPKIRDAAEMMLPPRRPMVPRPILEDRIMNSVANGPKPLLQIVAEATLTSEKSTRVTVERLAREGHLVRVSRGVYALPDN